MCPNSCLVTYSVAADLFDCLLLWTEDRVHAAMKAGSKVPGPAGRVEGPPLYSGHQVHPEVGAKGVNVEAAGGGPWAQKEAGPAVPVQGSGRGTDQVVVLEVV